jgi:hypothetical protein
MEISPDPMDVLPRFCGLLGEKDAVSLLDSDSVTRKFIVRRKSGCGTAVFLELGQHKERDGLSGPGCADFVILPAVVTFWCETVRVRAKEIENLPSTLSV